MAWLLLGSAAASPLPAGAQSVERMLTDAVEQHDRVLAARANLTTAQRKARVALGDWFPTLDTTASYGFEAQRKHESAATNTPFEEYDLKLSQLLWDFGKTNASVRKAALEVSKSEVALERTRAELLLEGIKAYANLIRAHEVVGFARQSRENIQRQTGLEEARVETGSGLSTDVLQAKTQLAGADARLIQAEGSVLTTSNRFFAVFQAVPEDVSILPRLQIPTERLATNLEDALATALENNFRLRSARLDEEIARDETRRVRADEFAPKIEGVLERKWQYDVAGTLGDKNITLGKVELTMPFNLGLTGIDALEASKSDYLSKSRTTADLQRTVTEEVRNAWFNLRTALNNAQTLQNQADIAAAFLELARREQQLGQRSLIDVLSGETSMINALSDAASAKVDALIAAFDLLNATGALNYEVFRETGGAPAPAGPPAPASAPTSVPGRN